MSFTFESLELMDMQLGLKEETNLEKNGEQERETMFRKVLTPSDVGKLNRLVIPKRQAESHFPLPSLSLSLSSPYKATHLSFQDHSGQQWRFRYCYWGSSQSYVMTKGWSRFVRAYNLEPGDTVLFSCDMKQGSNFFIDFCRLAPRSADLPRFDSLDTPREKSVVRLFGVSLTSLRENV